VKGFKLGDRAAVGCYILACGSCEVCRSGDEQYCSKIVFTYNSTLPDGSPTYGGYVNRLIVEEKYACRVPESLSSAEAAPLLCAGITLYSPMKHYGVKSGQKVGILGLGGLGHMGVLFAKEFGCEVTVFSTSPNKEKESKEVLGAHHFIVSTDPAQLKAVHGQFDVLINTISGAVIDFKKFIPLLKANGKFIFVGVSPEPHTLSIQPLIFKRILIGGSLIGSVAECQEMLNYCAEKKIVPFIEKLPFSEVNTALARMAKNDVHYRFVLEHPQ
jgi:D-arabinose 1-dehydrogenase-like Zn-dependent alcohol dehydrogenase